MNILGRPGKAPGPAPAPGGGGADRRWPVLDHGNQVLPAALDAEGRGGHQDTTSMAGSTVSWSRASMNRRVPVPLLGQEPQAPW